MDIAFDIAGVETRVVHTDGLGYAVFIGDYRLTDYEPYCEVAKTKARYIIQREAARISYRNKKISAMLEDEARHMQWMQEMSKHKNVRINGKTHKYFDRNLWNALKMYEGRNKI